MLKSLSLLFLVLNIGCATARRVGDGLVTLEISARGGELLLTLLPAAGAKINALAKPTLELQDGRLVTFDAATLTSDSAYYAVPPTARTHSGRLEGNLRVGVCPAGMSACQTVTIPVDETFPTP